MLFSTDSLLSQVEAEARAQGVDPELAKGILLAENSGYNPNGNLATKKTIDTETRSPKGAYGVMQVLPKTAQGLVATGFLPADTDLSSANGQIKAGVATLKEMASRGIVSPLEQAAYYNGGEAALQAVRTGQPLNPETSQYLRKVSQTTGIKMDTNSPTRNSSTTIEREGQTTTQTQLPPTIAGDIQRKYEATSAAADANQQILMNLYKQIIGDVPAQEQNIQRAAEAASGTVQANAKQQVIENQSKQGVATSFDTNLNDPENLIARNMEIISSTRNERTDLANQIAALTSQDFLSNPVAWFVNSVKAQPLIARHNALVRQENNAVKDISTAQTLTQQQMNFQPAAVQDAIQETALAKSNELLANAQLDKDKNLRSARASAAQLIIESNASGQRDLTQTIQVGELLGTKTSVSQTSGTRDTEQSKVEQLMLDKVNLVRASIGLDPFKDIAELKLLPKEDRDSLMDAASRGAIGSDPADSIAKIYKLAGATGLQKMQDAAPGVAQTVQQMSAIGQRELASAEKTAAANPASVEARLLREAKTEADRRKLGIALAMQKFDQEVRPVSEKGQPLPQDFSRLSPNNPYKLQYSAAALAGTLKGNPLVDFVTKDATAAQVTDQLLLAHQAAEIAAGHISVGDAAAQLQEFYQKGMEFQRQKMGLTPLGFDRYDTYPVTAKVYSMTPQKVDMMSKAAIENYLVRQVAAKSVQAPIPFRPMNMQGFN